MVIGTKKGKEMRQRISRYSLFIAYSLSIIKDIVRNSVALDYQKCRVVTESAKRIVYYRCCLPIAYLIVN